MTRWRGEQGQVTILALGLALVCFAVAGLAIDGTRAFLLRQTLQNAADGASTAAAGEIDQRAYYSSGGHRVVIDPAGAREIAGRFLALRGIGGRTEVVATQQQVQVTIRARMETSFLALVGISAIPVAATARAAPFPGAP